VRGGIPGGKPPRRLHLKRNGQERVGKHLPNLRMKVEKLCQYRRIGAAISARMVTHLSNKSGYKHQATQEEAEGPI
jgi:hypothetical protein